MQFAVDIELEEIQKLIYEMEQYEIKNLIYETDILLSYKKSYLTLEILLLFINRIASIKTTTAYLFDMIKIYFIYFLDFFYETGITREVNKIHFKHY